MYCNFHFSTSSKYRDEMVGAICKEIELSKGYLETNALESVYFGGGTPSLLEENQINAIFEQIHKLYSLNLGAEITLEANPDDLTEDKIKCLKNVGINRLSIGLQTFSEVALQKLNRAHSKNEALNCLKLVSEANFVSISVDFIYGMPWVSDDELISDLELILKYPVNHISCYALTVEDKTALKAGINSKKYPPVDDAHAARQFFLLTQWMRENGFDHYEISNFAKPPHFAKHNTSYWTGEDYLGIGPSAHSFNGISRQWNIANNALYMKSLQVGTIPAEVECLSEKDRYNEYLMTGLRTKWGISKEKVSELQAQMMGFDSDIEFYLPLQKAISLGQVYETNQGWALTEEGKFLSDNIISSLFV